MGKKLLEQREINGEFRLAGRMLIDIRTRPVDKHHVVDAAFPLADLAVVKFKKFNIRSFTCHLYSIFREPLTHSSITHRGFLSIYQRTATGLFIVHLSFIIALLKSCVFMQGYLNFNLQQGKCTDLAEIYQTGIFSDGDHRW